MERRKFIPIAVLGTILVVAGVIPSMRRLPLYEPVQTLIIILMAFLICEAVISRLSARVRKSTDNKRRGWLFWSASAVFACWLAGELFAIAVDIHARQTSLFKQAVSTLEESQSANAVLGGEVRVGWPVEESMIETDGAGKATMSIPVSGNGQKGQLMLEGVESGGVWRIEKLHLIIPSTGSDQQL